MCLLKTNVNDPTYTNDERFRILAEQINQLEKKYDKDEVTKNVSMHRFCFTIKLFYFIFISYIELARCNQC